MEERKVIKVKLVEVWPGFSLDQEIGAYLDPERFLVMESEEPDYIICSSAPKYFHDGHFYEYCKYPQVRIFIGHENYCPDFNLIDYGMASDRISFGDRYFRYSDSLSLALEGKDRSYTPDILKEKTVFANFISSHESEHALRGDFFKRLCEYKEVASIGSYLNNMPDGRRVTMQEKLGFQRKCKFTLCFESTRHKDFCTEKIVDAFLADSIPVYCGDPNVCEVFNEKAFIHVPDRDSFEAAIERIIELDRDDEKYLAMLREPIYVRPNLVAEHVEERRAFLQAIFEQPVEKAYRRSRVWSPKRFNDALAAVQFPKSKTPFSDRMKLFFKKRFPRLYAFSKRLCGR